MGEFQNVSSLTLSETRELIRAVLQHREDTGKKIPETECVFQFDGDVFRDGIESSGDLGCRLRCGGAVVVAMLEDMVY